MPHVLAFLMFVFSVVQQPVGQPALVGRIPNTVTQFQLATKYGTIGLLGHADDFESAFEMLGKGDQISLVYDNGYAEYYVVTKVLRYQAMQPNSPSSSFISLDDGTLLTAPQLFYKVYSGDHHLTLQTCIVAHDNPSWGRLFVIAYPVKEPSFKRNGIVAQ